MYKYNNKQLHTVFVNYNTVHLYQL